MSGSSVGVDSWAVDFGLLDTDGGLVGNPVCYRDRRTDGVMERVLAELGEQSVYACGLPVVAGPVEATALGNALVQARALGAITGDLTRLRGLLRDNVELRSYEPRGKATDWDQVETRVTVRGQARGGRRGWA